METRQRGLGKVKLIKGWWYVDISRDGVRKRIRVVPSQKAKNGKDEGETLAGVVLKKNQLDISEKKFLDVKVESKLTFNALADKFMEYTKTQNKKSLKSGYTCYIKHLKEYFGKMLIDQISPEDVLNYQDKRKSEGVLFSANREISLLRTIYNLATYLWKLKDDKRKPLFSGANPAKMIRGGGLKMLKEPRRDQFMKRGELITFLSAADEELTDHVLFAIVTGMRKGEQASITPEKVDFENCIVNLSADETKEGKEKRVPLCNIALNILKKRNCSFSQVVMRKDAKAVFQNGKAIAYKKNAFLTALEEAKKNDFHWHDFRHTAATYMEACGIPQERRERIMGHSDKSRMQQRYTHTEIDSLVSEVKKLDEYLREFIPVGYNKGITRSFTIFDASAKQNINSAV